MAHSALEHVCSVHQCAHPAGARLCVLHPGRPHEAHSWTSQVRSVHHRAHPGASVSLLHPGSPQASHSFASQVFVEHHAAQPGFTADATGHPRSTQSWQPSTPHVSREHHISHRTLVAPGGGFSCPGPHPCSVRQSEQAPSLHCVTPRGGTREGTGTFNVSFLAACLCER